MVRLIPLCLFLLVLPPVEAVQDNPEAAPEVKAYPTLAPGHHVGPINAMVFTPDGKRLITAGDDKTIQVWDIETGKRVKLFRPPVGPGTAGIINDLALAPDGKTLAVASSPRNGEVHHTHAAVLLNLDDGRMIPLDGPGSDSVTSVAFSKDGRRLALAHRQTLRVFSDLGNLWGEMAPKLTSVRLTEKGGDGTQQIAFSPSGDRIVTNSRDSSVRPGQPLIRVWDLKASKLLPATFPAKVPSFSTWSADGEQILTGHGTTSPVILTVWPATGGEPVRTYTAKEVLGEAATGFTAAITSIVHHSESTYFLTCVINRGSPLTRGVLFDLKTGQGKVVGDVPIHFGRVGAVSPNGRIGATTSAPLAQRIALFDLAETGTRFIGGPAELNNQAGWTATGNSITWNRRGKDGLVTSGLNLRSAEYLPVLREPVLNTVKKRDGVEVVQNKTPGKVGLEIHRGDDRVVLPQVSLNAHVTLPAGGPIDWIAIAHLTGFYLHDTKTGERIRTFEPVKQNFTSVSSSPDGKYLFATSERGVMHVYNPAVAKPLLNVYTEDSDWIAWTEEGYYAASPNGERLIGWTVNNKDLMREANLLTAEQFRNTLYRPYVIRLLLDKGSVAEALKAANAMRKDVPKGAADPEKLLPPEVSLKVDTTKLPKAVITVTARAGCKEQPIKSLRLLVDGRPLPGGVGRMTYDVEKAEVTETWTVEIPPGKHRLSVLARSKDDTPAISSAVLVDSPLPANQRPVVHHVAIGISKYADDKLKLKFAEKDALDLGSAIQKSCTGTLYQKVETTSLTNDRAKRDAVLKALDDTRKIAKSTDLLILSFAGHGIRDDGEFYLLTHEADTTQLAKTAISGADLRAKLADYPCQILLMLDACHSGAFAPLAKFKPATDDAARALADVEMRVAVMCAAQGHEEAFEAKDNGHFTAAVIRALQRDPRAFFDLETGELSVYHLQAFVSQEVSKATEFKQNPYLKMPLAHPPVIVTKFPMK